MRHAHPLFWRSLALLLAVAAVAVVLAACGSSSGSSRSEAAVSVATAPAEEEVEAAEGAEEAEEGGSEEAGSELENIIRIQIYGKFGGTRNEFDVAAGTCRIVKINTTPAEVKAGGGAVLDHERNASVLAVPAKGGHATAEECRKALETAIG